MATYFSILAWKIPWTEDPDGLQSMGLQRVGHDCVTDHSPYVLKHIFYIYMSLYIYRSLTLKYP